MRHGVTAGNLAEKYGIARENQDAFAARSHQQAARATQSGRLEEEIVPVSVKTRKGPVEVTKDEHIREGATQESLSKLKPAFKKENGTVTAGNSSGINDGAAALVVASDEAVNQEDLEPMGRIVSWAVAGVDPNIMGIGPVPASRRALKRAGLSLDEVDLVEINEAFAAQYLACEEELGLDREKVNVNGGAVVERSLSATRWEQAGRGSSLPSSTSSSGARRGMASLRYASAAARASRWSSSRFRDAELLSWRRALGLAFILEGI